MTVLFWTSALVIVYVYAGYPLLLVLWAKLRTRRVRPGSVPTDPPTLSIVIAARNEARRLAARIENLLALDYPTDRRQIIVVSDGSTDDTLDVLRRYPEVDAIGISASGKAQALNVGVEHATGEILVFADARQMFSPDALKELVAPFADPAVGGVTGELLLDCEASDVAGRRGGGDRRGDPCERRRVPPRVPGRRSDVNRRDGAASSIGDGIGLYWRYEKSLRRLESAIGSTLGATGAIYALRRSLRRPLPADTILDDVLTPMWAVLAGYRVVFNEHAVAFDRAAVDVDAENRRKVRTLAGNVQILLQEPRLLLPGANPVWLQYVSHKLGRLLIPFALVGVFAGNLALADRHPFFAIVLTAQCGVYLLGGYGAWLDFQSTRRAQDAAASFPVTRTADDRTGRRPTLVARNG
ncbi:MAG TPA: glycosyltransferase family 2 protein [Vicinamibacterales bacterium]